MDSKLLVETVADHLGRKTEDVDKLLGALAGVLAARCSEMDNVPAFAIMPSATARP